MRPTFLSPKIEIEIGKTVSSNPYLFKPPLLQSVSQILD